MLLPGIHWHWLRVCLIWALFMWLLYYVLMKKLIEEDNITIGEEE
tara:strand:+ start:5591 stop:5725 length:135 start_codon:yes stop_codon:yes gene_type:complete